MSIINLSCFTDQPQDFLVCVTVHKAKNLCLQNANTFVTVHFNNETRTTATYRNSENPYFNEYFVFEVVKSPKQLMRQSVNFTVHHKRCLVKRDVCIGSFTMDLLTVWNQTNHIFYKKWGKFEQPGLNGDFGYLQIDISIVSKYEPPAPAITDIRDYDIIEKNLLRCEELEMAEQRVKYFINLYEASFADSTTHTISVTFCGQSAKFRGSMDTNQYAINEQAVFFGAHPSLCQIIAIDILANDCCQAKVEASACFKFGDLCLNNNANAPTFGPAFVYFYAGPQKNTYVGKILLAMGTENTLQNLYAQQSQLSIFPFTNQHEYWEMKDFEVRLILLNVDFLQHNRNQIKFRLECEDTQSTELELPCTTYPHSKMEFIRFEGNARPCFSFVVKLPDLRVKYQHLTVLQKILLEYNQKLNAYRSLLTLVAFDHSIHLESLKDIITFSISKLKQLKTLNAENTFHKFTQMDSNFIHWLDSEVLQMLDKLSDLNKKTEAGELSAELTSHIFDNLCSIQRSMKSLLKLRKQKLYPTLIFNAISTSVVAYSKIVTKDQMYSQVDEARGIGCGIEQSVFFRPVTCKHTCQKCGCIFGKASMIMFLGSGGADMETWPPNGFHVTSTIEVEAEEEFHFVCKVNVYQAKIRAGFEKSGLANAKLTAVFDNRLMSTDVVKDSLSPVWNDVFVFQNVRVFSLKFAKKTSPFVLLALDDVGKKKSTKIGFGFIRPKVKLMDVEESPNSTVSHYENIAPPHLTWIPMYHNGVMTAELLASAEFVQIPEPEQDYKLEEAPISIPPSVCPVVGKYRVEVVFAGLRRMAKLGSRLTGRYCLELVFGDLIIRSGVCGSLLGKASVNFLDPLGAGYVFLPENMDYWPSITIKHIDCLNVKNPNIIGAVTIRDPKKHYLDIDTRDLCSDIRRETIVHVHIDDPEDEDLDESIPLVSAKRKSRHIRFFDKLKQNLPLNLLSPKESELIEPSERIEARYTWWTKFYNSFEHPNEPPNKKHKLRIINTELEKVPEFSLLEDWAASLPLSSEKKLEDNKIPTEKPYCIARCSVKIKKAEDPIGSETSRTVSRDSINVHFQRIASLMLEMPVHVRVYVVQGINLRSLDLYGSSDAYIQVTLGSEQITDRSHFVPNQCSPIFGRQFDLKCIVPRDHLLKVAVFDRDEMSRDDLIGTTVIDLEDRLRSKHNAACGIPREYCRLGYNAWRDALPPSDILANLCRDHGIEPPTYLGSKIEVDGTVFVDSTHISVDEDMRERLSLTALHQVQKLRRIGYPLVPEHVETRSLYRDDRPGIEQGKLQMWVEIFRPENVPPPVDITPYPHEEYELRVIIWNTKDVTLQERNIWGTGMSDIYVKCWLIDPSEAQFTDVHFRSLSGEGNFNWRMIFSFRYSIEEDMMLITKHRLYNEKYDTIVKTPPVLHVQVWDNDTFSPDDFLGATSLSLSWLPAPPQSADKCDLRKAKRHINLFNSKLARGWFPVVDKPNDSVKIQQTGKVEMEIEILTADEAKANPAGQGRNAPLKLQNPQRPDTSFNWVVNPIKSVEKIVWPRLRKCTITCLVVAIIVCVLVGVIYALPREVMGEMLPFDDGPR